MIQPQKFFYKHTQGDLIAKVLKLAIVLRILMFYTYTVLLLYCVKIINPYCNYDQPSCDQKFSVSCHQSQGILYVFKGKQLILSVSVNFYFLESYS